MSRIGIDCRFWGVQGGIGRYLREFVMNLQEVDTQNDYVLFCLRKDVEVIPERKRWRRVLADIPYYSIREQLELSGIFSKEKLDLLHIPHFNIPLLYGGKFIVTIHDLIWHDMGGLGTTTHPAPVYWIKYLGYRFQVKVVALRASKIIVPSNFVKTDVVKKLGVTKEKVVVIYEGVSNLENRNLGVLGKYGIKKPYLLYVGNLYPHKNVEQVVRALKRYHDLNHDIKPTLVIVSGHDAFWEKFKRFVKKENAEGLVNLVSFVPDEELSGFYESAAAFISPTLSEGFGLPGLEAMFARTPVLCSNIPVLREVYKDAALYFDPKNIEDIKKKIEILLKDDKLKEDLIAKGSQRIKFFSWKKMAIETLGIYKKVLLDGAGDST